MLIEVQDGCGNCCHCDKDGRLWKCRVNGRAVTMLDKCEVWEKELRKTDD